MKRPKTRCFCRNAFFSEAAVPAILNECIRDASHSQVLRLGYLVRYLIYIPPKNQESFPPSNFSLLPPNLLANPSRKKRHKFNTNRKIFSAKYRQMPFERVHVIFSRPNFSPKKVSGQQKNDMFGSFLPLLGLSLTL